MGREEEPRYVIQFSPEFVLQVASEDEQQQQQPILLPTFLAPVLSAPSAIPPVQPLEEKRDEEVKDKEEDLRDAVPELEEVREAVPELVEEEVVLPGVPLGVPPIENLPAADEKKVEEHAEEQFEPQKEIARDLQPLMAVLQKTERYSEELQKRGLAELEEVKQRANELQQKHPTILTRGAPCQIEREACIKCYREKEALQCLEVAAAYTKCTRQAMR